MTQRGIIDNKRPAYSPQLIYFTDILIKYKIFFYKSSLFLNKS